MNALKRLSRQRPSAALLVALAALAVATFGSTGGFAIGSSSEAAVADTSQVKKKAKKAKKGKKAKRLRGSRGKRGKRGLQGPPGPQGVPGAQGPPGKGTAFLFRKNGNHPTQTIISVSGLVLEASCTSGALSVKARATQDHSIIHLSRFNGVGGGSTLSNVINDDFTKSDGHIDLGKNNQGLFDYVSPGGTVLQVSYLTVSNGTVDNCVFAGYYSVG